MEWSGAVTSVEVDAGMEVEWEWGGGAVEQSGQSGVQWIPTHVLPLALQRAINCMHSSAVY